MTPGRPHESRPHHPVAHELMVEGLDVTYRGVRALETIDFATSCGRRVALLGTNGAGKTTLIKAIAGLVPRAAGTIRWRGTTVGKWSREFAYLPQREEVDWSFPITVRGLVEMGRYPQVGCWGRFTARDEAAVDAALENLDLVELQRRQIRELSGGQQQRAFLARAMAQEAHVLLLDEPFTGLDRRASAQLGEMLATLAAEDRLIIASHHDLHSAPSLFDEALLLATRQLAFGPIDQVLQPGLIDQAFGHSPVELPPQNPTPSSER